MKNIVILVNGTWNDSGSDNQERSLLTNVIWLQDLCVDDKVNQFVWYTDGVGTGNLLDKAVGGALGFGLSKDICAAYRAVCKIYELGDQIFFFGFSRGAYTVRTAADMIAEIGLADLKPLNKSEKEEIAFCEDLFAVYRKKKKISDIEDVKFFNSNTSETVKGSTPIRFVGVWDTVGTAGIPDHYRLLNMLDGISKKHNWANTQLSPTVAHGRHAVAMDEWRESFVPAFWTTEDGAIANNDRIKQLWFSGVHTDVGGGYENRDLGNISMAWMAEEAEGQGLILKENPTRPIPAQRAMGVVNDSLQSVFKRMWTRPRGIPNVFDPANAELFHPSVIKRYNDPESPSIPSWSAEDLAIGKAAERVAWAKDRWTPLGIFIDPTKTYEIAADGNWKDKNREYDPAGKWLNQPNTTGLAGYIDFHKIPNALSWLAKRNRDSSQYRRVLGAWRVPSSKPFMLMGVVADGRGVRSNANGILPEAHTQFEIGHGTSIGVGKDVEVKRGGYLYCFPNDVWSMYSNNSGHMNISITRNA